MNSGRALIWLPTRREEKYRAKQAIDTLFVRLGDVLATALVAGAAWLELGPSRLAGLNVLFAVAWLAVAWRVARPNEQLAQRAEAAVAETAAPQAPLVEGRAARAVA
jgi:AAA family ATP:ADP antiporter